MLSTRDAASARMSESTRGHWHRSSSVTLGSFILIGRNAFATHCRQIAASSASYSYRSNVTSCWVGFWDLLVVMYQTEDLPSVRVC